MTIIKIIDAFTFYGLDVLCLAALTCLLVQIFKRTLLKKVNKKIVTFLPFATGTLLYAVYAAVRNLSVLYVLNEYVSVLEHGLSVGAAATLLYVLYEQFVREKKTVSASAGIISTLIEGYVPSEHVEKAAVRISEAIEKDVTGNGAGKACEILGEYADGEIKENDLKLLSRLIIETLAHINL